ncbi:hypothetical protein [Georgenia muralis]
MSIGIVLVDIFWRGALVDRERVVGVDGFRAWLPLGTRTMVNAEDWRADRQNVAPMWEYSATQWQTSLARLIDSGSNDDFDRYFREAGLIVRG